MPEADAIERVDEPVTTTSLATDLRDIGVAASDTVLVHSSLSAIGWVSGGPQAVVDALREVVTGQGTVVMPTHSTQYTDPAHWENPPIPDEDEEKLTEAVFDGYRSRAGDLPATLGRYRDLYRLVAYLLVPQTFGDWSSQAERPLDEIEADVRAEFDGRLAAVF